MTVRERKRSGTLTGFFTLLRFVVPHRVPMSVNRAVVLRRWPRDEIYYRCPRCNDLLDREFMAYCSSCGQRLNWRSYKKAERTYYPP